VNGRIEGVMEKRKDREMIEREDRESMRRE